MKLVSAVIVLAALGGAAALSLMIFFGDHQISSGAARNPDKTAVASAFERPTDMVGFCNVLAYEIQAGDTTESVEQRLGPGTSLDPEQHTRAVQAVLNWQSTDPELYPSGSVNSDKFLRWTIPDGCTLQLQFRDDRLINHSADSYVVYLDDTNTE